MRLGNYDCVIKDGTLTSVVYGKKKVTERHRHRYECNNSYRDKYESWGIKVAGTSPDGNLVEMIEAIDHPFFLSAQSHPEFNSRPNKPQALFKGFIKSLIKK
jgi:CTP synthase